MGRVKFLGLRAVGAIRLNANPADGETVTIGPVPAVGGVTGKRFEFDNNAAVTAGNILVTIGGSAALSAIALRDKINTNKPTPVGITAEIDPVDTSTVRLYADAPGAGGNLALADTGAAIDVSSAVMTGGEGSGNQTLHRGEHVVTALDVAAGNVMIDTGLSGPRFPQVDCFSAAGLQKALTSLVIVVGSKIQLDFDGATNPVAGDKISWGAYE
jgi:hypothetical protein